MCSDFDLYNDKIFHEPILKSLIPFVGHRIMDSPAVASLGFVTIMFHGAGCQTCVQNPAILEDRLELFLVWVIITEKYGMASHASS